MFGIQDIKLKNFLSRIAFLKEFFSKFAFISKNHSKGILMHWIFLIISKIDYIRKADCKPLKENLSGSLKSLIAASSQKIFELIVQSDQ